MEFLVKKSVKELNENLNKLKNEIDTFSGQNQSFLSSLKNDYFCLNHFKSSYISGDIDLANMIASNFDTYLRESIPMSVWELMGNSLVYEKNHLIKKEDLPLVPDKVSTILKAYSNGLQEYAEKLENELIKSHTKISEKLKEEKDNLLLECLNKLKEQNDPESQNLVKRIKNTLN